ncbi:hypothetical protein JTE90_027834 [Oedothorax gibbosus]|uniref:Uncharacterized protein n=1 Tax=Oedothorax gibbosus TaxID=931172 RepID=A0AAV6U0U9_9ARAC|nr:hypothetical protein JTE90_027834 [Oedothorax gibbosus]
MFWRTLTETGSATGGSLNFPTPLPSAFNSNTLAAWGSSGAPQRPSTNGYTVLLVIHTTTQKIDNIKTMEE